jgi:hypothetical protein
MDVLPKKLEAYPVKPYFSEQQELNDRLSEILPPYISETPLATRGKRLFRIFARFTLIICLLSFLTLCGFLAHRAVKEKDTFWYYLTKNHTIVLTLMQGKKVQDTATYGVLETLTASGKTMEERLIQLQLDGYAQNNAQQIPIIYDLRAQANHKRIYEQVIQPSFEQAYRIYNNFTQKTEQEVYGITTNELIYQKGLNVPGYGPKALEHMLFGARRYFPFALIAGRVADIDPLLLLKIFEIETRFSEVVVGPSQTEDGEDDIGIAQNNLAVLPNLIRHILDPSMPAYSPFFEFLSPGKDWAGKQLSWNEYLPRLETELAGTYDRQENPHGKYYTNMLKAPHIGAFLAAYHIKRDKTYRFDECLDFYKKNAKALKVELDLKQDVQPYHWAYYTFYNGGPKRWHVLRTYLKMRQNQELIPPELQEAVDTIKRRNREAQRIGNKNEYLKGLVFDHAEGKIVRNDGLLDYGLFDFSPNFKPRELMSGLPPNLAMAKKIDD